MNRRAQRNERVGGFVYVTLHLLLSSSVTVTVDGGFMDLLVFSFRVSFRILMVLEVIEYFSSENIIGKISRIFFFEVD